MDQAQMTGNFGDAIRNLKNGLKVTRAGWNGKGMFLFLATPSSIEVRGAALDEVARLRLPMPSVICMRTAQDTVVVGWLASQTDLLAEDWMVVP